jgi:hypothetical protein
MLIPFSGRFLFAFSRITGAGTASPQVFHFFSFHARIIPEKRGTGKLIGSMSM